MPDISQLELNGTTYDICDATTRDDYLAFRQTFDSKIVLPSGPGTDIYSPLRIDARPDEMNTMTGLMANSISRNGWIIRNYANLSNADGDAVVIGNGGLTAIGGGESAVNLYTALVKPSVTDTFSYTFSANTASVQEVILTKTPSLAFLVELVFTVAGNPQTYQVKWPLTDSIYLPILGQSNALTVSAGSSDNVFYISCPNLSSSVAVSLTVNYKDANGDGYTPGSEYLILGSDTEIRLYTNCGTIADRQEWKFNTISNGNRLTGPNGGFIDFLTNGRMYYSSGINSNNEQLQMTLVAGDKVPYVRYSNNSGTSWGAWEAVLTNARNTAAPIKSSTTASDFATAKSGFTVSSGALDSWGRLCILKLSLRGFGTSTSSNYVPCNVPATYRPPRLTYGIGSNSIAYCYIGSNGDVTVRFSTAATSTTTDYSFTFIYLVAN